jgi:hypothetical membrane protein
MKWRRRLFNDDESPLVELDILVTTTRYLRLGMVAVTLMLGVSVVRQTCEQERLGSISAYYYTPARTIFVGGLIAAGVCLICLRGDTSIDDWLLNCAGLLAPFVAFIPTPNLPRQSFSGLPDKWSAKQLKDALSCRFDSHLQPATPSRLIDACDDRNTAIRNNVTAAFVVLAAALIFVGILGVVARYRYRYRHGRQADAPSNLDRDAYLVVCAIYLAYVIWYNADHPGFVTAAHPTSAIGFFVFVGLTTIYNAIKTDTHKKFYYTIAGLMAAAPVLLVRGLDSDHQVFNLEATEIALFAVFWIVQTRELWNMGLRTLPAAAARSTAGPATPAPPGAQLA